MYILPSANAVVIDFFFHQYFLFCPFVFRYHCYCVLLALLFAIAIWVNKYFASSSGRKGWSACAGPRKAGLGRLLPLRLVRGVVPSRATFSSLFHAVFGDGNQFAQIPLGALTAGFHL